MSPFSRLEIVVADAMSAIKVFVSKIILFYLSYSHVFVSMLNSKKNFTSLHWSKNTQFKENKFSRINVQAILFERILFAIPKKKSLILFRQRHNYRRKCRLLKRQLSIKTLMSKSFVRANVSCVSVCVCVATIEVSDYSWNCDCSLALYVGELTRWLH